MQLFQFYFGGERNKRISFFLFAGFYVFYVAVNTPFLNFMSSHKEQIRAHNPFYGVPFGINLFNFDPSMYYGFNNSSIIHPLFNVVTGTLTTLANHTGGNLTFLLIQAAVNALSVVCIFLYLQKRGNTFLLPVSIAVFFGISSYNLFTSFIPDTYPYAQLVLLLSVLYFQSCRILDRTNLWISSFVLLLNFSITSTNVIPAIGVLLFSLNGKSWRDKSFQFLKIIGVFLLLVVFFTALQNVLFDKHSWINNFNKSIHNGGFSYVGEFSFSQHWKAIYMLVISPVLTPAITMIDPGIAAFATNLSVPYPLYVTVSGLLLIVAAAWGFLAHLKQKEVWGLMMFPGFAFCLHILEGYGLKTFSYDLYLYAGHYLFAFFLLGGIAIRSLPKPTVQKTAFVLLSVVIVITLANNLWFHAEALNQVKTFYK